MGIGAAGKSSPGEVSSADESTARIRVGLTDHAKNAVKEDVCPGCGSSLPFTGTASYDGYYNTSPACWQVYTQVLGAEFGDALLFGQVHQLTVDTYAVQHAGGTHPDKSVGIHLAGLHLVLERRFKPPSVARYLQRLSDSIETWPHFPPPGSRLPITVRDIATAGSPRRHIELVREWSRSVWQAWSNHHAEVAQLVERSLGVT